MRYFKAVAAAALLLSSTLPSQASKIRRGPTAKHKTTKTKASAPHQRVIDDARATQIQSALVKAGYLPEVTGHWDGASQAAMQKLQGDNGWQTKLVPDSRALIKLGLGPSAQAAPATANDIANGPVTADGEVNGSN